MAWTINTYAGTKCTGQPSNWRTAMFELCRAVNERKVACGVAVTQFRITSGGLVNAPTMAQLEGLRFNQAKENLIAIQDAIVDMLEGFGPFNNIFFYEDDTFTTQWTVASMETDIGTNLSSEPIRPQEARFWQAQKDALDRMIYIERRSGGGTVISEERDSVTVNIDLQDAWDTAIADTPSASIHAPRYQMRFAPTTPQAFITDNADFFYTVPGFPGAIDSANYILFMSNTAGADFTGIFDMEINSVPATYEFGDPTTIDVAADLSDVPVGSNFTIHVDLNVPSTVPFTGNGNTGIVNIGVRYFIDISAELTDQA